MPRLRVEWKPNYELMPQDKDPATLEDYVGVVTFRIRLENGYVFENRQAFTYQQYKFGREQDQVYAYRMEGMLAEMVVAITTRKLSLEV